MVMSEEEQDALSLAASWDEESFLRKETQDPDLTQVTAPSSKLASEPEIPAPSSSVRALMERATNFLQVPWKVSSGLKADFDPPAFSSFPGFSGGGQILLATPGLSAQHVQECSRTCLHAGCRGGRAVGGLSKDPVCPNGQCRITEAHLKKAYAAKAQVTRLTNTGGLLTAYLDGMLCLVTVPELLASELRAVSGTLLQISGFQGQALGRSLAGLVVERRQLWLSQARVLDADKSALLDVPISPGHTFGPAVEEILQRCHREWLRCSPPMPRHWEGYMIPSLDRAHAGFYRCIVRNRVGALMQRRTEVQVAYMLNAQNNQGKGMGKHLKYMIPSLDRAHAGFYRCIVRNRVGALMQRRTEVQVASVHLNPSIATVIVRKLCLRAITLDNTLVILSTVAPDAGRYYVQAVNDKNGENKTSQPITLSVENMGGPADPIAPTIIIPPRNTSVASGTSEVTMECVANARPLIKLSIAWRKDGVLVTSGLSDFNRRLTILSPTVHQSGRYECEAVLRSSSVPSVSAGAYLHVLEPPQFVKEPERHITAEMEKVVDIPCQARGVPKPEILWFKDAVPISSLKIPRYRVLPGGTLQVNGLLPDDTGMFQCFASNQAGELQTNTYLAVTSISPNITAGPADSTVIDGMSVILHCETSGAPRPAITWQKGDLSSLLSLLSLSVGVPKPEILWFKDAVPISSLKIPRYRVLPGGTLQVNGLLPDDTGMFQCFACNQAGEVQTNTYLAVTSISPNITAGPADSTVIDGMSVILHCETSGAPRPAITWQKARTRITSPPQDQSVIKGTKATMACGVTHDPSVTVRYVWEKEGSVLHTNSNPRIRLDPDGTLHISQTWSGDIGTYTCHVTSVGGNDSRSAHLRVRQLPHAPENPVAVLSLVERRAINLTWAKPFDGNSPLIRYILEVSENNAPWTVLLANIEPESSAVTVSGLIPARSYQFRICAVNDVGKGQFSKETERYCLSGLPVGYQYKNITNPDVNNLLLEDLIIWTNYEIEVAAYNEAGLGVHSHTVTEWTLQGVPTVAPGNVHAEAVNSTAIRFSWTAPSPQFINGINQGYKLLAWEPGQEEEVTVVTVRPNFQDNIHVGYIKGLKKFTEYSTSVLCFTTPGDGPRSTAQVLRTHEDIPGPVGHLSFTEILDTSLKVSWREPIEKNGILTGYRISWEEYNRTNTRVTHYLPNVTLQYRVTGLTALTTYTIEVAAMTSQGQGQLSSSTISSGVPPELPGPPTNMAISNIGPRSVTLQFKPGYDGKTSISRWQVEAQLPNEPDARSLEVPNLNPYTFYRFRMRQVNIVGTSPSSQPSRKIQTLQAPPDIAPANVTLRTASETSLWLRWVPLPEWEYNGNPEFVGYRVQYSRTGTEGRALTHGIPDRLEREFTIEDLEEWAEYEVRVQAVNGIGAGPWSQPVRGRTRESVPSSGPTNISAFATTSSSILVRWSEVPEPDRNGLVLGYKVLTPLSCIYLIFFKVPSSGPTNISAFATTSSSILVRWSEVPEPDRNGLVLGYKVVYKEKDSDSALRFWTAEGNTTHSLLLSDLGKYVLYEIKVLAFTRIGDGVPSNPPILERTLDDVPGPPVGILFPEVRTTSVRLIWQSPAQPNGIILAEGNATHSLLLSDLGKYVLYEIKVLAFTRIGDGVPSNPPILERTLDDVPGPPVGILFPEVRTTSVRLIWQSPAQPNGIILGECPFSYPSPQTREPSQQTIPLQLQFHPPSVASCRLKPFTSYQFRVKSTNDIGDSEFSEESEAITTLQDAPDEAPVILSVTPHTTTSVLIRWQPPSEEHVNGILLGFQIRYRELLYDGLRSFTVRTVNSPTATWAELTSPYSVRNVTESSLTQYEAIVFTPRCILFFFSPGRSPSNTVCDTAHYNLRADSLADLSKHKRYEIRLSVYNAVGEGPTSAPQEVFVGEAVPTGPPQNVAIQSATATQLDITWDPPPVEAQNGDIQGYKIFYWEFQRQNETERLRTLFLPEGGVKLKNLTGYTTYMISVGAFNAAGDGPRSPTTRGRTQQAAPSASSFIHFGELTTTSVNVSWGEPVYPNGIIEGYRLIYEPCTPVDGVSKIVTVDVKGNSPRWMKIKDLADGVTYNFRIRAKTFAYGPEVEANITTANLICAPGPPGDPFISRYGSALTIHWASGDPGRGPISRYVIEARPSGTTPRDHSQPDTLRNSIIEVSSLSIHPPSTLCLCYIKLYLHSDEGLWDILIKDIPKEVTSYTFSMDILKQGVSYDFRVIGVNDYGYGSPSAPSPSISAQKVAPFYEEWWFLVVVALVGLIFILLLVFILIIRGQSKKYAKKSDSGNNSNSKALSHGEMVSLDEGRFPALELNNRKLSVKNSFCRKNGVYTRSPPRPSPGSLHYSDEDVSTKYNDLIPAESSSLTEKPSEISESQFVNHISILYYLKRTKLKTKQHFSQTAFVAIKSSYTKPCKGQGQGSLYRPKGSRTPTPQQQPSIPPSQNNTLYRPPSSLAPGSRAPIAGFSSFV
ncbi:UNVERIFIED_CONTAM: hypothetical protein FKN15_040700 [Acipenser sinensis]